MTIDSTATPVDDTEEPTYEEPTITEIGTLEAAASITRTY